MSDTYTCATCGAELVVTSPAELELERLAAERDTARELARDAVQERDRALSALEEARNFGRAQDEKAHRFLEERNGAREALVAAESALEEAEATQSKLISYATLEEKRALAAEARADALQRERDEMEKSKWYERDRRKEAESRADAAWRAGAEAMKAFAAAVLRAGADLHAPAAKMRSALYQAAKVVEILDPPRQPPPSATAAPASRKDEPPADAPPGMDTWSTPAEEEKCPECECPCHAAEPCTCTGYARSCGGTGRAPSRGEVG